MSDEPLEPITIYDHQPDPERKVEVRRIPSLAREGIRMLLAAGRSDFLLSTFLQLVGGLGIAVQLVVGQRALQTLLSAAGEHGSLSTVLPWALAVGAVSTLLFVASAVQRGGQGSLRGGGCRPP